MVDMGVLKSEIAVYNTMTRINLCSYYQHGGVDSPPC